MAEALLALLRPDPEDPEASMVGALFLVEAVGLIRSFLKG